MRRFFFGLVYNLFLTNGQFCHLLIGFANRLDPDQDWLNVCPDLDPNSLTLVFQNVFLKKAYFEKKQQQQLKPKMWKSTQHAKSYVTIIGALYELGQSLQMKGHNWLFACWEILHACFCCMLILFRINLFKNSFRRQPECQMVWIQNRPNKGPKLCWAGPDLGPICLQRLSCNCLL